MTQQMVERDGVRLSIDVRGTGPAVVLLASLGRGASDFDHLASALAGAGYTAIAIDPRGVGESIGPMDGLTLHDLADDVAAVIEDRGGGQAHVLGHAFGQRLARCVAADHPSLVRHLAILAAGGAVQPPPEVHRALLRCFDLTRPVADRLEDIRLAFFAGGNDPAVWLDGWWPDTARMQGQAVQATPLQDWWDGGTAAILVIQGAEDRTAPVANGRMLRDEHPDRVQLVELDRAGHALLPEQPGTIAELVIGFFGS